MLSANPHLHNASHWPCQHFAMLFDSVLGHFFRPILLNVIALQKLGNTLLVLPGTAAD